MLSYGGNIKPPNKVMNNNQIVSLINKGNIYLVGE